MFKLTKRDNTFILYFLCNLRIQFDCVNNLVIDSSQTGCCRYLITTAFHRKNKTEPHKSPQRTGLTIDQSFKPLN